VGARLRSDKRAVIARSREVRANDLNVARDAQLSYADFRVPVDKGNLQKTIRKDGDATAERLRAVAKVGGMEVDGVMINYEALVNFGHATAEGGHVPADPFWTEAEEIGKATLERRSKGTVRVERS
jgi:hypothetical protein